MNGNQALLPFLKRLGRHSVLSEEEKKAVLGLPCSLRKVARGTVLVAQGDSPDECRVLLSGFLYRNKLTGDGNRQIVSVHIPGEMVDLHNSFLKVADHNVQALSHAEVALVPRADIRRMNVEYPAIARALLVETLIDASILREWMLNLGRRNGRTRIAHLICELALRLEAAGLSDRCAYTIPMKQEEMADAMSLTQVHVNRTLKALSSARLISRDRRWIRISDWHGLAEEADFQPDYLHLDRAEANPRGPMD